MEMPEINRCFGMFPVKYGCFLISLFGLGKGGIGLAGIILFGLVENSAVAHFVNKTQTEARLKKFILLTIGLSSLLLLIANTLLFIGLSSASRALVSTSKWVLLVLCVIIMGLATGAPILCFFNPTTCVIGKLSTAVTIIGYIAISGYLIVWLYFMVVVYNFELSL